MDLIREERMTSFSFFMIMKSILKFFCKHGKVWNFIQSTRLKNSLSF